MTNLFKDKNTKFKKHFHYSIGLLSIIDDKDNILLNKTISYSEQNPEENRTEVIKKELHSFFKESNNEKILYFKKKKDVEDNEINSCKDLSAFFEGGSFNFKPVDLKSLKYSMTFTDFNQPDYKRNQKEKDIANKNYLSCYDDFIHSLSEKSSLNKELIEVFVHFQSSDFFNFDNLYYSIKKVVKYAQIENKKAA